MEPDPIVHNPPSRRLNNRRHHQWNFMITHFQIHNDGRAADHTTFGDRACTTGVLDLTKNCTCALSTGTPSNRGTSTVVCADTTRNQSLNNIRCNQLVQELHLWDLVGLVNSNTVGTTSPKHNREVQHSVDELSPGHPMEIGCRSCGRQFPR